MTHIIIPGQERPLRCRWCNDRFGEMEIRAFERHVHRCTQENLQGVLDERAKTAFLREDVDPEWGEYVRSGRYAPLTRPKPD